MEKVERSMIEPVAELPLHNVGENMKKWYSNFQRKVESILVHQGLILTIIGFLLGRALVRLNFSRANFERISYVTKSANYKLIFSSTDGK